MTVSFRKQYSFDKRIAEANRVISKFRDRIPVIVERAERSDLPEIDKKKYLVPCDLTFGQFMYVVRRRAKLPPEKALFCYAGESFLPPTASLMSTVYQAHKDKDGFLYMRYTGENTFG